MKHGFFLSALRAAVMQWLGRHGQAAARASDTYVNKRSRRRVAMDKRAARKARNVRRHKAHV